MQAVAKSDLIPLLIVAAIATAVTAPLYAQEEEPSRVLITNVNIFDGVSEELAIGMSILVEGNLISAVATAIPVPPGTTIIDGGGRTLMPGLIDAHVHIILNTGVGQLLDGYPDYIAALGLAEAQKTLMRGFTTVRDTGGQTMGISQAIDEGHFAGPRIYSAGAAIGMTSGHADFRSRNTRPRQLGGPAQTALEYLGLTQFADGVPEVLTASREQFRQGAHFLKIFAGGAVSGLRDPLDIAEYSFEEIKAAADEAKRWNTYLAVHAYTDRSVTDALNAGAMSIEHATLISEPTMRQLAERNAFLSAQAAVYLTPLPEGFSEAQRARHQQAQEGLETLMSLAKEYEVKLAFGTDRIGSFGSKANQLQEFTYRSRWFTPVEILRQATSINGELMALSGPRNPYPGKLGVVEEGALADLLLVTGNPLENIELMTDSENNFVLIMKDGVVYKNTLNE